MEETLDEMKLDEDPALSMKSYFYWIMTERWLKKQKMRILSL
jgi:hypothetical protein